MAMKYFIAEDSAGPAVLITSTLSSLTSSEATVSTGTTASSTGSGSTGLSIFSAISGVSTALPATTSGTASSTFCSVSSSSSLSLSTGVSSKTVPSLSTTVSKCANGLLIISFRAGSGVNETLVWPCISKRSPVLTFTLSRLSTSISLKAPRPLIFTYLSFSNASSISWKNSFTKLSAFFLLMPCFSASKSIRSCMFSFSFIIWKI